MIDRMLLVGRFSSRLLGEFIKRMPQHRGKGRLVAAWHRLSLSGIRRARLPGGATIECDLTVPYDRMVWLGLEERAELAWLARTLQQGDAFLDGGANIGLWSLVAAKRVGTSGTVIAVEPNPTTASRLRRHVATNGASRTVTVVEAALSSAVESAMRFDVGETHNLGRLDGEGAFTVAGTTIDELARHHLTGVKLDIEGHELEALKGAERVLTVHRPWFMLEFNTLMSGTGCVGEWGVDQLMRSRGYECYRFGGRDWDILVPADWSTSGYINLLYRPIGLDTSARQPPILTAH